MRKVAITATINDKNFTTSFTIDNNVKEYQIADEAYRLAMLFAETQVIARDGYANTDTLIEVLTELDYNYTIEET